MDRALREGVVVGLANHTVLIARGGEEYRIADSCAPIRVADGEIMGAVLVFRDVTEEYRRNEELAEERRRLEYVLSITGTGINITDTHFDLQYVDPGLQRTYGDPTGRKCYEYFRGREAPCVQCGIPEALKTGTAVIEERVMPLDENRIVRVHTIPLEGANGEPLVAEFKVDITGLKKAEKELLESNHKLEKTMSRAREMAVKAEMPVSPRVSFRPI